MIFCRSVSFYSLANGFKSALVITLMQASMMASADTVEPEEVPAEAQVVEEPAHVFTIDDLPEPVRNASLAYQQCVSGVMSTLEPAAVKREQIATNCDALRETFVNSFPEFMRKLIKTQAIGKIDNALTSLEETESAVFESSIDYAEMAEEMESVEQPANEPEPVPDPEPASE